MTIARWPNVILGPLGERMAKFLDNYPKADEIYITSGRDGDHGAVSHHYGLSYGGSPTAAIDIGAGGVGVGDIKMRDFAKWLYDNYADFTVELIHSTPFADDQGFYVKNQRRNPGGSVYGGPGVIGHFDHIHWATSAALMTAIEQRQVQSAPARLHAEIVRPLAAAGVANTSPVWGWDASDYDWQRGDMNLVAAQRDGISFFTHKSTEGSDWRATHYQEALERARGAGIPVLGAYHFLWPGNIETQVNFWMDYVEEHTPWWREVPWIWQIDAEKSNSNPPRWPSPDEIRRTVELVGERMARDGNKGWVVAYAPRWLYRDTLVGDYDIWASNYSGSGAARPFKQQYQGVTDLQAGWNPVAGRKPKILQFASDGQVGTQHTCCVDKYDGDLYDLMRRCAREPAPEAVTVGHAGLVDAVEAIDFAEAMGDGQLLSASAIPDTPELLAEPSPLGPSAEHTMALTYEEQRELLSLLREHSAALRAMAKPKATTRRTSSSR